MQKQSSCEDGIKDSGSSSKCYYKFAASAAESVEQQPRIPPIRRNTLTTFSLKLYIYVCVS